MTSKAIIFGVGLPMVIFGAFIAILIAPLAEGVVSTIEFVGSLIGILGVVFMISGMFYKKEIIIMVHKIVQQVATLIPILINKDYTIKMYNTDNSLKVVSYNCRGFPKTNANLCRYWYYLFARNILM